MPQKMGVVCLLSALFSLPVACRRRTEAPPSEPSHKPTADPQADGKKPYLVFSKTTNGAVTVRLIQENSPIADADATVSMVREAGGGFVTRIGLETISVDELGARAKKRPVARFVVSDRCPSDLIVKALAAMAQVGHGRVVLEPVEQYGEAAQRDINVLMYRGLDRLDIVARSRASLPDDLKQYVDQRAPGRPFIAKLKAAEVEPVLTRLLSVWPERHVRIHGDQFGHPTEEVLRVARIASSAGAETLSFFMVLPE